MGCFVLLVLFCFVYPLLPIPLVPISLEPTPNRFSASLLCQNSSFLLNLFICCCCWMHESSGQFTALILLELSAAFFHRRSHPLPWYTFVLGFQDFTLPWFFSISCVHAHLMSLTWGSGLQPLLSSIYTHSLVISSDSWFRKQQESQIRDLQLRPLPWILDL